MPVNVGPGLGGDESHHIALTDADGNELGLICYTSDGSKKAAIATSPFPHFASQLRQGRGKHSDRRGPFEDIPLSDFSGGLAMLHHDEDESKYYDGKRIDTSRMGEVIHGGLETYTTGLRDADENWPGNVSWLSLYSGGTTSKTTSFVAGASYNVNHIVLILKKVGAPTGNVTVELLASDDSSLKSKSLTIGTDCLTDFVSEKRVFTFSSVQAVTATTTYKVKVSYSGGSSTAYVDVAIDGSSDLYYRVLDDTTDFIFKTFEYKNALYGVSIFDDGSVSKLYIAGDRGAADSNSGALTTTVDATKSWTNDEWIGDIVLVTGGPGANEEQPWRTITDNDATTLTHTAWTVTHTTETEYIILSDKWKALQTLTGRVHDFSVVRDKVYFAFGFPGGTTPASGGDTDKFIRRYRAYNNSGTWTEEILQEDNNHYGAERLLGILSADTSKHEITIADLYIASMAADETVLSKFQIPFTSQDMYAVLGTLCENDRAWTDTVYTNSVPNPYYYGSIVNVSGDFTTGKCAHWKLDTALDIRNAEAIALRLNINPAGVAQGNYDDAGDIRLVLADSDANEDEYNLDGTIEKWYDELLFLLDPGTANADMSDITDIYWKIQNDEGQVIISIWGSILLVGDRGMMYKKWHSFEDGEIVNNIIEYAGGTGAVQKKPWMLTDRKWYYIEDDIIKEMYLKEIEELKHPRSGEGAVVNDRYLYANAGETIQRFHAASGQLDNLGPDVDYGLPSNRRGIPCTMASYPGKVLAGIDAETGYSSVIYRKNHGWHELYRAPENERIRDIHVFARSDTTDRVYISEGADVLWVPISINPQTESGYEYVWESVLETPRIYGGLRETEKYYHALTIVSENLSSTNRYIQVDYKTSENSSWTTLSGNFTTSPRQRRSIVSTNDTAGRWIQFRLRSYTNDRTETPKIVSVILDSLEVNPVNDMFVYTVGLKEGQGQDLRGTQEDQTGVEALTQLETWRDDPRPLTLSSISEFEDGKLVKLENLSKSTIYHKVASKEHKVRLVTLNLIEVS